MNRAKIIERLKQVRDAEFSDRIWILANGLIHDLESEEITDRKDKLSGWIKYEGTYEKRFYDIVLYREVIYGCFPNVGTFHTPDGRVIENKYVRRIRPSIKNRSKLCKQE